MVHLSIWCRLSVYTYEDQVSTLQLTIEEYWNIFRERDSEDDRDSLCTFKLLFKKRVRPGS